MRRTVTPELLDSDQGTPAEVEETLRDLRFINRWFGGVSTTRRMLKKVTARVRPDNGCPTLVAPDFRAPGSALSCAHPELTLLDVGAGSGDVSLSSARQLGSRAHVRVTLLDRIPGHMPRNGARRVTGDALALPFLDSSFDLVACSLLVHHLESDQIVRFVNEALRVARIAVLLNDLRRGSLHLALMYAGFPFFGRLTRHDGVASVRRSYTPEEMLAILRQTRAVSVELENHYLFRMGIIAWKQSAS
jgi:ubiquinone/menaquinone biosynthesis C-methylase UbiE